MKSCIIIPFFGKWPAYYPLFLKNCDNLPFDVLIFTDLEPTGREPDAVKIIPFSLQDFRQRIRDLFNLDAAISSGYKLCDFRPSYALVFEEYLKEYAFWGWGDMDLVYGDTQAFLSDKLLEEFDVISMRKYWVSGSFCLLRNDDRINRLFLQNDSYKKIFTDPAHFSFSECGKQWSFLRQGEDILALDLPYANFTQMIRREEREGRLTCYFRDHIKESINPGEYVKVSANSVQDNNQKSLFHYHYISEKKLATWSYPHWTRVPEEYFIDRYGFFTSDQWKYANSIRISRQIKALPQILGNLWSRVLNRLKR